MSDRRLVPRETLDPLLEALIELARVVNRAERNAAERRRSIHVMGASKRGGQAA